MKKILEPFIKSKSFLFVLLLSISGMHYLQLSQNAEVHDFYRRLYYVPILLASFRFGLKTGTIFAFISALIYMPHIWLFSKPTSVGFVNQLMEIVMFIFIGILSGYFTEQRKKNELLLEEQLKFLQELEKQTHSILECVPHAMIVIDDNFNVVYNNLSAKNILNKNINSNQIFDLLSEFVAEKTIFEKIMLGETTSWQNLKSIKLGEKYDAFKCSATPYYIYNQKIDGMILVLENVTEFIKMEKKLERSARLSSLGEMASGIAHEIRNPLGIIRAIIQEIEIVESDFSNEGKAIVLSEIDRISGIIQETLNYAKPMHSRKEMILVSDLIRYLEMIFQHFADKQSVKLEVSIQDDIEIFIDRDKIVQALLNIVLNGIQAMPNGGIINIECLLENQMPIIKIIDHGTGISKEFIQKVFDPFFTTKDQGTGLGLAISQQIIDEHGGQIDVLSDGKNGTEFKISLLRGEKAFEEDNINR